MSAPTMLDLTSRQEWRTVPMPGSNLPLELVRLAARRGRFTIHGRFPAGFDRPVPGGYAVSEEFLVLEGELELEGVTYRRGDLTVVPSGYRRTTMRSPEGCRVLAWFGGPASFVPEDALDPGGEPIVAVAVNDGAALPSSPVGAWRRGPGPDKKTMLDVVSAELDSWRRGVDASAGEHDLVRTEL